MPTSFEGLKSATETCKSIITLSTAVVTATVAFLDKVAKELLTSRWLYYSWIAFGIAIAAAILTLMAITGVYDVIDKKANGQTLTQRQETALSKLAHATNIRAPALCMLLAFAAAMIFLIVAAFSPVPPGVAPLSLSW